MIGMSEEVAPLSRFRFQRMLEDLERKEGRGTELISVYIPPGKQISEAMNDLRNEWGTAIPLRRRGTSTPLPTAMSSSVREREGSAGGKP